MSHSVILLFGGESRERMVSVASAQNMVRAISNPTCWFWDKDDQVYEVETSELLAHNDPFHTAFIPTNSAKWSSLKKALKTPLAKNSIFVLALHGGQGENGNVQSWLEKEKLCFTGSSSKSCHITFDKILAKNLIKEHGIKVAPHIKIQGNKIDKAEKQLKSFLKEHQKIALKPVADGSSVGLIIVDNPIFLDNALSQLRDSPEIPYLAERFIEGTELTIGVIEEKQGLLALPCTEVRTQKGHLFDYNGKYLGVGSKEITPAEVSDAISHLAKRVALTAHTIFGCFGYSRTDIIIENNKDAIFLETNTLPGLTKVSLIPQQLAVQGITLNAFLQQQIELAMKATR